MAPLELPGGPVARQLPAPPNHHHEEGETNSSWGGGVSPPVQRPVPRSGSEGQPVASPLLTSASRVLAAVGAGSLFTGRVHSSPGDFTREKVLAELGISVLPPNRALTDRDFERAKRRWNPKLGPSSAQMVRNRARTADAVFRARGFGSQRPPQRVEVLIHYPSPPAQDAAATGDGPDGTDSRPLPRIPGPGLGGRGAGAGAGVNGMTPLPALLKPKIPVMGMEPGSMLRARLQRAAKSTAMVLAVGPRSTNSNRQGEQLGKKLELRRLKEVWASVDEDGSGTLDRGELRKIFKAMGKNFSDREFDRAMNQIDGDGSDEVDFDEFTAWWAKEMAKDGIVAPSTFMFKNLCVRAVLRQGGPGGTGEHHWIADDIKSVLFSSKSTDDEQVRYWPLALYRNHSLNCEATTASGLQFSDPHHGS